MFTTFPAKVLSIMCIYFVTNVPGSTLTDTLQFRQEGHPELKCYSAPIKSSSKICWSGRQLCY